MESWKKQPSSSHDHLLRVLPDSARSLSQRQYYMFLVCCCSITKSCLDSLLTACTALRQTSLSFTISRSLLKLMSIESVMSFNHLILHRPLLLPSIFPSIRVFSNELALHIRWPKYWSFSFTISPSSGYSELISLRMDWFDLLVVERTLKSPPELQFESISSSVFSLLYGLTLPSLHDYWKNHSFDCMDLCQQIDVYAF